MVTGTDALMAHACSHATANSPHTNFRMETFDEHQSLRVLRPTLPDRPTRQKPHLLFRTGMPERASQAVEAIQDADGPGLP